MGNRISMATRKELLKAIRERYRDKTRREKSRILDEFVAVTGYHRKHALRLLNQANDLPNRPERFGRKIYGEAVQAALVIVWEAADRICGKRLKAALPSYIESMERHGHLLLDAEVRRLLLAVSASTIDRLLSPVRSNTGRKGRQRGTNSAIRNQIPVRTFGDWGDPVPGYFEGDLVAHCGGLMAGSFVHSFVLTDIASGWTDVVPLLVREQGLVVEALNTFRGRLPVAIKGLDTDNDGVFINEILVKYCTQHKIEQTRSRAYQKNDQAWVEQKNGSVVRRLVGYNRFSGFAAARTLARIFNIARLYVNFFQPSFKLRKKTRIGAKVTRRYFTPATPCERLLSHEKVAEATKAQLRQLRDELDPVLLLRDLRDAQTDLARISNNQCSLKVAESDTDLDKFLVQLPELWKKGERRPTHRKRPSSVRTWRTRVDPYKEVWADVQKWLEESPDITSKALFNRLQVKHPGEFASGQLRTLQRRVREWRQAMAKQLLAFSTLETSPVFEVLAQVEDRQ